MLAKFYSCFLCRYRSTVEHTNAFVKNFAILGSKFRGRVFQSDQLLQDAIAVICNFTAFHVSLVPMRTHVNIAGVAVAPPPLAAPVVNLVPDLVDVDTTFSVDDFKVGDKVEFYDASVGGFVAGVVHYVAQRSGTCIVRVRSQYHKGILPHHMRALY